MWSYKLNSLFLSPLPFNNGGVCGAGCTVYTFGIFGLELVSVHLFHLVIYGLVSYWLYAFSVSFLHIFAFISNFPYVILKKVARYLIITFRKNMLVVFSLYFQLEFSIFVLFIFCVLGMVQLFTYM